MSQPDDSPTYGTLEYFQQRTHSTKSWWCIGQCKLNCAQILIGRSPEDCRLLIRDNKVSRVHAEIFITSERRVYLRCLSSKGLTIIRSDDTEIVVELDSPPKELRNRDSIHFKGLNTVRIVVNLKDISERECAVYSSGDCQQDRVYNYQTILAQASEVGNIQECLQPTPGGKPKTISLTPNMNRARTASTTPPSAVPYISSDGIVSESVRVRKMGPIRDNPDEEKQDHLDDYAGSSELDERATPTPAGDESPQLSPDADKNEPKSILRSSKKKKRRKSVRFSAFSDEASIVNAVDGSGGVTPAKKVFPPHIQKGISASRASPALVIPTMQTDRQPSQQMSAQGSRRTGTPFPRSSTLPQRWFGIGQPLQSIRRSVRAQKRVSKHTATPRPAMGMYDVPVVPRSPGLFTKELPLEVCQSLKSTKLLDVIKRVKDTPAKFSRLTPAKRSALDSVYRGLSKLNIHTPRIPDTPMPLLDMPISPIQRRQMEPTVVEDVEENEEDADMHELVSDMVSLLDLKGDEKQDSETEETSQQGGGGFSLSFLSSFIPGLGSSQEDKQVGELSEIREVLEEENVMDVLRRFANESPIEEPAYPRQTQASFVGSNSSDCLNYSQMETLGVGTGDGASFCVANSTSPLNIDPDVDMADNIETGIVKKTYTPETDREKAKDECTQMFTALAQTLGVSVDQIPQIAAHKLEFGLECLKNLVEGNDDIDSNIPGPQFQVNGQETANELCQIFGTNSQNMSRTVSEHLKEGLTELLQHPDRLVELSPESRNFAIASLSEVLGAPDSAEKMSGLLVSAPKTVKSPMSVLDGVCRLAKNPSVKQKKTVRINPNAQFNDDECEFSDVDQEDMNASMASVDNVLDLSHLVNNLGDNNHDDFEEPTVALQKDLYDQFKDIEKTEYLTVKLMKQATDLEPEEHSTEELVKKFDEQHDSNLSDLGFTTGFRLHRPDDEEETDSEDFEDSLPVPMSTVSEAKRAVRSICHEANASFTTEEMSNSLSRSTGAFDAFVDESPDVLMDSPVSHPIREFSFINNNADEALPPSEHSPQQSAPQPAGTFGWQPKRRLSTTMPIDREVEVVNASVTSCVGAEAVVVPEPNRRKRTRDEAESEIATEPPRKRLRRASGPQQIHTHDSLSFHVPLSTTSVAVDDADVDVDIDIDASAEESPAPELAVPLVLHVEEKEFSGGSDTDELDEDNEENSQGDVDMDSTAISAFAVDNATNWSHVECDGYRGIKRGFEPESPRVGKTRLFHQDTDMDELPQLNLARCDSSFCAPVQSDMSITPSWCSSVTVNGFPFLSESLVEQEFDDELSVQDVEEDILPIVTDDIVAIDMHDEPQEAHQHPAYNFSAPLTPLKRICAQRQFPRTSYINRTSRATRKWHSAQPATRTQARTSRGVPSTPKPSKSRPSRKHPRTDFISRRKNVVEPRRRSEQLSSSLATVEEVPNAEDSFILGDARSVFHPVAELAPPSQAITPVIEAKPANDLCSREDSLPSMKESVENEPLGNEQDDEDVEILDAEEPVEEPVGSAADMNIELPADWSHGKPAHEVAKEAEMENASNEEIAEAVDVYSIPILARNDSIPHNETVRSSRKRSLRDLEADNADEVIPDANQNEERDVKRRRVESPGKALETVDVEEEKDNVLAATAQTPTTVSTPKHRRPSMSSRRAIIRKAHSAKTERTRPATKQPVRRSLRIANRIRRKSGLPEVDQVPIVEESRETSTESNEPTELVAKDRTDVSDVDTVMKENSPNEGTNAVADADVEMPDATDATGLAIVNSEGQKAEPQGEDESVNVNASDVPQRKHNRDTEMPSVRLEFMEADVPVEPSTIVVESLTETAVDVPLQSLDTSEAVSRESSQPEVDSENEAPEITRKPNSKSSSPLRIGGVELRLCRLVDLKKELRKRRLSDKGKKIELISRLSKSMANDPRRPTTKRKTRATCARTQMKTVRDSKSSQKRSSKKKVTTQALSKSSGRTRLATRKSNEKKTDNERPPLRPVLENGRPPRVLKIGGVALNQLRVVDLRRELKNRSLDYQGKKPSLIARLEEYMQSGKVRRS